jgi:hypothetical protein
MNDQQLIDFALTKSNATPRFKLKYFVGGAQLTPYAMLKQWFMELRARQEAADSIKIRLRKSELSALLEEEKLNSTTSELQKELIKLEIMDKKNDCVRFERQLRDTLLERDDIINLIKEFSESEFAKLPDGTRLLDVFGNKELEEELEQQYWTVRMAKQAALDVMFYGRVNEGNMDAILMMHPEQQKQVLSLATQHALEIDNGVNQLKDQAYKKLRLLMPEADENTAPNHFANNLLQNENE